MKTQSAIPTGITVRALAALAAMCLTAAAALTLIPAAGANGSAEPQTIDGIEITVTGIVDVGDDIQISGSTATRVQTTTD